MIYLIKEQVIRMHRYRYNIIVIIYERDSVVQNIIVPVHAIMLIE